ncbi:hypothetical protein BH18ACT11_BH18ACT11_15150 [soil metagenome]
MAKPVILAVDGDPRDLRTVVRDLRCRHAREYSDAKWATEAAIRAINGVSLDYCIQKPLDQTLYPNLDDWQADYRPTFDGLRVVGTVGHQSRIARETLWTATACLTVGSPSRETHFTVMLPVDIRQMGG